MKKLFLMAVAVGAMTFASCGSNQKSDAPADQTELNAVVENATDELSALLESGDVNKFEAALEVAKDKVAELLKTNPEVAKEYLSKVQNFLKENTDKIKDMVGDNELVSAAVSSLTETPAESIINNLKQAVGSVEDAGQQAVDDAAAQVNDAADAAKQAVEDKANEVKEAAEAKVDEAKQAAADKVNEAADKVNEKVNEGADKLLKGAGLK